MGIGPAAAALKTVSKPMNRTIAWNRLIFIHPFPNLEK
jgi:hypothetical protein